MTTSRADELRSRLIRNHETAELTPFVRGTRYESLGATFTAGLAARDLGVSVDRLAGTIRALVGGVDVGTYQDGGGRYDVRLRLEGPQRADRHHPPPSLLPVPWPPPPIR